MSCKATAIYYWQKFLDKKDRAYYLNLFQCDSRVGVAKICAPNLHRRLSMAVKVHAYVMSIGVALSLPHHQSWRSRHPQLFQSSRKAHPNRFHRMQFEGESAEFTGAVRLSFSSLAIKMKGKKKKVNIDIRGWMPAVPMDHFADHRAGSWPYKYRSVRTTTRRVWLVAKRSATFPNHPHELADNPGREKINVECSRPRHHLEQAYGRANPFPKMNDCDKKMDQIQNDSEELLKDWL